MNSIMKILSNHCNIPPCYLTELKKQINKIKKERDELKQERNDLIERVEELKEECYERGHCEEVVEAYEKGILKRNNEITELKKEIEELKEQLRADKEVE